jgi:hypothetical protein
MSSNEDPDHRLRALFERDSVQLVDAPFVNAFVERLAAARRRRALGKRLLLVAGIVAIVALSPWLIAGSIAMTNGLDALFSYTAGVLATPLGMVFAGVCAGVVVVLNRKLLF